MTSITSKPESKNHALRSRVNQIKGLRCHLPATWHHANPMCKLFQQLAGGVVTGWGWGVAQQRCGLRWLMGWTWLLGAGLSGFSQASATPPPVPLVSAISLERDCFGCDTGSIVVLRRDGTASYTVTGKARHGTEDRRTKGAIRPEDFDALARLAVAQGFFSLNDSYESPEIQDGPWATTGVTRGAEEKRVYRRDGAGPPGLVALESAIEAVRARIQWLPER